MKLVNLAVNVILLLQTALSVTTDHPISLDDDDDDLLKSIQSEDGDIIDCIDIYKQPAFSHPALKDHKIQMKPSYVPTLDITSGRIKKTKQKADIPNSVTAQLWHKSGSCPEGTVPIRRIRKESDYRKHGFNQSKETESLLHRNHSMSIMLTKGFAYIGAKGDIAIFNPPVELDDEYTLSHISLENGERGNFEAVRSGWAVNPGVYGDRQTRFFSYWTVDGSQKTGCFDHTCPGFVQVRNDIALGATVDPISTPSGLPSAVMTIYIFKDPETNNWWVNYGEDRHIGYWPGELFSLLRHHATTVQWGGDVYSSKVGIHPHTATGMGSGDYAFPDGQTSGEVRRTRVLENSLVLSYPEWATTYSDEFSCYSYVLNREVEDPEFYYGGPGKDPRCP